MRRIEAGDTALQLRGEEAASLDPGAPAAHQQLYYALCRGETPGHSCAPARATCRLASHGRPGLLLAPLKLETVCQVQYSTVQYSKVQCSTVQYSTVCQEPGLVIIHDLLSDREVRAMQSNALRRYTATAVNTILEVTSATQSSLPPLSSLSPGCRARGQAVPQAGAGDGSGGGKLRHRVCSRAAPGVLPHYTLHLTHYTLPLQYLTLL